MQPRQLTRSRADRVIGGVCGGVARHWNLDPVLVRVGAVAGLLLWGATAVLYLVALLVMPDEPAAAEGAAAAEAAAAGGAAAPEGAAGGGAAAEGGAAAAGGPERPAAAAATAATAPLAGRNRTLAAIGVVVLVLVAGPLFLGLGLAAAGLLLPFALLVLGGLAVAWLVTGRTPAGGDARQTVRLTLLGLGVLALVFLLAVASFWGAAAGGDEVIAGVVIVSGLALVASAFARPARWLILPALALAIPAAFVAAAGIDLDGGIGEKRYRPTAIADVRDRYEVGAGSLTVDLRDVDLPAGERRVAVDVGMGEAIVLVPEDVCVSTDAELGMGGVHVFERDGGGVDVDFEDVRTPPAGTARLVVEADVGLGAVEVGHAEHDRHRFGRWVDQGNLACEAA